MSTAGFYREISSLETDRTAQITGVALLPPLKTFLREKKIVMFKDIPVNSRNASEGLIFVYLF